MAMPFMELKGNNAEAVRKLRLAMLVNGVDMTGWPGGTISATHGDVELADTLTAFRTALGILQEEGAI
jgi:glutamate-1-semialdehyde 2,1-aminomutase